MLSYLIITYLLSLIGFSAYWFLMRKRLSFVLRKKLLLAIVGSCLIIPLFFSSYEPISTTSQNDPLSNRILATDVFTDFCPADEVLEACYMMAVEDADFCQCEKIEKANLLYFKESKVYNFLDWQKAAFWKIMIGLAGILLIALLLKFLFLFWLVHQSKQKQISIDGEKYTILFPKFALGVGAFQLIKKYIIWQPELDHLPEEELKAVLWHEVSHIQQKDTWIKISITLLQLIWVINPFYYLLKKEINRLSEFIADENAVTHWGNAKGYAELLLKMKMQPVPMAVSGFKGSQLKDRVQHLFINKSSFSNNLGRAIAYLGIIIVTYGFVSDFTFPVVQQQFEKLKVYHTLAQENQESGRNVFCKDCFIFENHH